MTSSPQDDIVFKISEDSKEMKIESIIKLFTLTLIAIAFINISAFSDENLEPKTRALILVDNSALPVIKRNQAKATAESMRACHGTHWLLL